ncbi:Na+/H+-dicarboxylate symporter [Mucilaginibacter mallensis]|uniref:Na+/H+-dicarboxylate symporter n=1 Tax=Mucilaginibacter mallensis TaxID=652787 RepID=A0A1H1MPT9_MUCMA|nr:dicarboxylate/amino acid:cation symporter [Mucilaginibacter mallensis]SDR87929.1 Na+/H+-dicarboxylate symporter [Mucilaginibacter mallensis]
MSKKQGNFLKHYGSILLLLAGLIIGSVLGIFFGAKVELIKPLGDIFINLLFTVVVPLVFFAIASAIANVERGENFGKLITIMFLVFIGTELLAASLSLISAWWFPIHAELADKKIILESIEKKTIGDQITQLLTASDFFELLSRKSMLALIIFSILTGFGVLQSGDKGKPFKDFLNSGNEVLKNILAIIMKIAPLGLGAYFAVQVGTIGPKLFGTYRDAMLLYHGVCLVYFVIFFSLYAFLAGGFTAVKLYWQNNIVPSATAIGTCSSIATIPANLEAAKKMGIPEHIRNLVIPLGAPLHKDGSAISAVIKIATVFAMFHRPLAGVDVIVIALGISVVCSIVEGGIPNGGYIAELLVISVYGFPPEALPAVMIIGTLVDPVATVLNATGDTVVAMLIAKIIKPAKYVKVIG